MLDKLRCDKLFSSIHNKWKEDICLYTSLYLIKTYILISQKMKQVSEDFVLQLLRYFYNQTAASFVFF